MQIAELTGWWLFLYGGYLALISARSGWELVVGVVIAGSCAALGATSRRAFAAAVRPPRFVRRALWLPIDVAVDAVAMTRLLVTGSAWRIKGSLLRIRLPEAGDGRAERAYAVLLASASPGGVAVDVEGDGDGDGESGETTMTVHRLTGGGKATEALNR